MEASKKKVFIGLNINLDAKIDIKSNDDFQKIIGYLEKYHPDLKNTFVDSVKASSAREELVCSDFMETCIKNFKYEFVLGGQEGFFLQNCVASFKDEIDIVLHLPCRAKELIDFVKGVAPDAYAYEEDGSLVTVSDLKVSDEAAPIHIIAEYPADLTLTGPDGEQFTTSRANRFILTYDTVNSVLRFDAPFVEQLKHDSGKDDVCLISGFHLLSDAVLDESIEKRSIDLFKRIRQHYNYIHYEVASNESKKVFELMREIYKYVDSIGVNEAELELLGKYYVKDWEEVSKSCGYVTLVTKLMETLHIGAIFFHTAGLYVSVISKDSPVKFDHVAIDHGFKTAERVIIERRSVNGTQIITVPIEEKTKKELDEADSMFQRYRVNYHNARMIKPISSTVGLGDTISSSIVLGALTHKQ